MFLLFVALALVTILIAWVFEKALSALERWPGRHSNSELNWDYEMEPLKHRTDVDFGTPVLAFAMFLLFCLVPNAVTTSGKSITLHEISDSVQASMDVDSVNIFISAWRAEYPVHFLTFFVGLPVTVIWLFRRSPAVLGVAACGSLLMFWLKMKVGIAVLGF